MSFYIISPEASQDLDVILSIHFAFLEQMPKAENFDFAQ
jgi:hypothetical protein